MCLYFYTIAHKVFSIYLVLEKFCLLNSSFSFLVYRFLADFFSYLAQIYLIQCLYNKKEPAVSTVK